MMKKEKTFTMAKITTMRWSEKEELEGKCSATRRRRQIYKSGKWKKKKNARRSVSASRNMKRLLESFYEEEEEMLWGWRRPKFGELKECVFTQRKCWKQPNCFAVRSKSFNSLVWGFHCRVVEGRRLLQNVTNYQLARRRISEDYYPYHKNTLFAKGS